MLFDEMPERYTVSFVTLIQGYNQRFRSYDAIWLFSRFHGEGHELNPFVFSTVLKLLVIAECTESGFSVHACVCKLAPLQVSDAIECKDMVSWTGMVTCYAENECFEESLKHLFFLQMRIVGFKPNNFIFASMLKACVALEVFDVGKAVHGHAFKTSYSGDVDDALRVFEEMPKGDVIPCSFMIAQYAQSEHSEETIALFCKMRQGLVLPNQITLASLLQAFASLVDLQFGKQIHYHIVNVGLDTNNSMQLFVESRNCTDVSWNRVIVGYVQAGNGKKALSLFKDMLECQVQGSEVTYSSVLHACSGIAAMEPDRQTLVGNALIDMYAKCGSIRDARLVFNMLRECDQVSWSAMIAGYSVHGLCREALKAFELMQETECKPDKVTFVGILSACSNAGLFDRGQAYFKSIIEDYGIEPCAEHYMKWGNVASIRKSMKRKGVTKEPGLSWIVNHGGVHYFSGMLEWLNVKARNEGHVPDCSSVLLDVDDVDKEQWLWVHSERLALAYGLIRTPSICHVHIIKNLRICAGNIIIRDRNHFHHFQEGIYSCVGYW
uniref:DYW domain-containing protein n=1 Tax=Populus trichocarpa TaxID=3694 RepID=A0A2K2BT99_POPTR